MGFEVHTSPDAVTVELRGWDRAMNWRTSVAFELNDVVAAGIDERWSLEGTIDHRAVGFGSHDGTKRPDQRRVGTMLGRGVAGKQFWAVSAGDRADRLVVLEMRAGEFARVVLGVDDPEAVAGVIQQAIA